ncbi:TetR/AcrR family transcriptional regulator [Tabrizicola oligotrophica]|uniref:TetR/AcrR family transcriptional regulator n=1 Tax=Tabrizicola oligotrophica TaxID=2710650 RepID=A0A6M0QXQ0_9RHOB|nr:TetR/AcrR family transcriptional regulator [Tabrizicola oligotrophica]NEY92239.1 TetR/AcrR family transcriptional regulator [Tabrizicola oligotrophica]
MGDHLLSPAPGDRAAAPDRRRQRGDASAQRIIDATIDVIADEGLAAVTMQRVAAKVGSSNALVVFHFGSKDNLFRAVLQFLSDQFELLWSATVRTPDKPPEERLRAAIDCAQHFSREHPKWVSAWVVFGSDRRALQVDRMISLPNDLTYKNEARALVDEIARTCGYPDVDADALAETLNYLVQGAWYWDNANPDAVRPGAMRKGALMLLSHVFPRHFAVDTTG